MRLFTDFAGRRIRLTDERLAHILDHPEIAEEEARIGGTLAEPDSVVASVSDTEVWL